MSVETLYDVLGISQDADPETVKRQYKALAREYHPDRCGDDERAIERWHAVNAAYEVLGDAARRTEYDAKIAVPVGVQELFLANARGRRVLEVVLPKAPAEPRPGVHLARVEAAKDDRKASWIVQEGQGASGTNGAENGDFYLILADF